MDITVIIAKVREIMEEWFALKENVPTKTSDIINNSGFITSSHTHGNISSDGKIGNSSGKTIMTGADGVLQATYLGTNNVMLSTVNENMENLGVEQEADQDHVNLVYASAITNKENNSNKTNTISSSSTKIQYPSAKAVYDKLPISKIPTIDVNDSSKYTIAFTNDEYYQDGYHQDDDGTSTVSLNSNNELVYETTSLYGELGYYYSTVFSESDYYTLSCKIKKPIGIYPGKDFAIMIGDEENAVRFFFGYYNISGEIYNDSNAKFLSDNIVNARNYTNISITRNGDLWTLDYNDGEYVNTLSSAGIDIPNKWILCDMEWHGASGNVYVKDLNLKYNNQCIADLIYPVGSIYMNVNSTSPETLFGGKWEQITLETNDYKWKRIQ